MYTAAGAFNDPILLRPPIQTDEIAHQTLRGNRQGIQPQRGERPKLADGLMGGARVGVDLGGDAGCQQQKCRQNAGA